MKAASRLLIFLGVICIAIGVFLFWQRINPNRLAFAIQTTDQTNSETKNQYPTRLTLEQIGIDLPIIPARLTDKEWETTLQGVSYLISSPIPGNKGNSIFYGHNYNNILGNLEKTKHGDVITIQFGDKTKKLFEVVNVSTVTPDQTHILKQTEDSRITLYTCTGFLDSKRFVVTAVQKKTSFQATK